MARALCGRLLDSSWASFVFELESLVCRCWVWVSFERPRVVCRFFGPC